ncbi:MAG TPA: DNA polymerase III subunit gamma/tau C-terminal domain-containing protein, partial [Pseudoxanthomonas sp.]|nr:DNA polymerase III subunit gamma/tau C-terminal domain-containing protein [Pseudoxanthomonas sp.]
AEPASAAALAPGIVMPARAAAAPAPTAPVAPGTATAAVATVADAEDWLARVAACDLKGPARELAAHSAFVAHADGVLTLALAPGFEYLRTERSAGALAEALAASLGAVPRIAFQVGEAPTETLNQRLDRERDSRQAAAEQAFLDDPGVRRLIEQHGARVVPDSIRPADEN